MGTVKVYDQPKIEIQTSPEQEFIYKDISVVKPKNIKIFGNYTKNSYDITGFFSSHINTFIRL